MPPNVDTDQTSTAKKIHPPSGAGHKEVALVPAADPHSSIHRMLWSSVPAKQSNASCLTHVFQPCLEHVQQQHGKLDVSLYWLNASAARVDT
jgi:hypothetical protein